MTAKYEKYKRKYQYSRRREKQILVHVTEVEREIIKTNAQINNLNVNEYMRMCALEKTLIHLRPEEFTSISKSLIFVERSIDKIAKEERIDEEDSRYKDLRELVEDMQGAIFGALSQLYEKYL